MTGSLADLLVTAGCRYVRAAPGSLGKAALAARVLDPRLRERPRRRLVETRSGDRFAVDTQDLIQRYLYLFGAWEPHLTRWLERRLKPGDGFVDLGANVGVYAVLGARLVGPAGHVVAVEASPDFHRRLLRNAALNGRDNIRAVNAAVSDGRRRLTFVLASSRNMGANSIVPYEGPAESSFEAEAFAAPDLLRSEEVAAARVIMVDVEGAEGAVVRGMEPLLDRLRPDAEIVVEVTPERMERLGDSVGELMEIMHRHGFHAYRLPNDYAPASYPRALRRPAAAVRVRGAVEGETELVFSRTDAETLA
ncbi:FkbM family methyltransferase [Streptomyces sp. NPDC057245]|uniref:FkbM family methyltransferase n=1 Tax=Streptomyces TaxID=1883 RepID=UPI0027E42D53|nr:FkbM family methyltransferase [Streptomyces sp. A108]